MKSKEKYTHYITPEEIIIKKKDFFFPNSMHFYKTPPHIVKGEMQYLFDSNGKKYTDFFAGVTVLNCGHSNPQIEESISKQLSMLQHTSIIYLTQPMVDLAEKLARLLPGDMKSTFFCNSGTEANEGALLLSRMHTGKKGFLSFKGGLHGRSYLTMSVTGIPMWRIDPFLYEDVYFAECFVQEGFTIEESAEISLKSIDSILSRHGNTIAACIFEPIQGNGGINMPPSDFFIKLKSKLDEYGILLIADEVQTGIGRTGTFFAVEQFGIVPDIITYAKALGNGAPIGAFSARPNVATSFSKPSASTLGGNPVSASAALAVLSYFEENNLCQHVLEMGALLKSGLISLKEKHSIIMDVRGTGLMLGVALPYEGGADKVDFILEEMKNEGYILGKNGLNRNVIAFQPPLVINAENISSMLSKLDQIFSSL